ncbi:MAG TPA: bile acid:sodium symporter family protein [Gammaproteobacteria bacterium]
MLHFFPLWAIILSAIALWQPAVFVQAKGLIAPLLGVIMFGMGMTLSWRDFREIGLRPWTVLLGAALQFGVMPAAAWLVSAAMQLQPELFIGMLLVGACSGGTASNVICYLARGDVALSITLTTVSTLLGIFMTPWLTLVYAGQNIDVPALPMLITICQIILLPVTLGVVVNALFGKHLHRIKSVFPAISAAAIVFIIAIIAALNKDNLASVGVWLSLAVILHNTIGLATGYGIARLFRQNPTIARTLAIEVGMQNSGLAVALAMKHFSGIAALPGALFSIWHNISGSILAAWWSREKTPGK